MGQGGWEETELYPLQVQGWFEGWEIAKERKLGEPRRAVETGPVHRPH